MNKLQQFYYSKEKTLLWNLALLVFIAILVFHGTYIRIRPMGDIPELDWVVLARLMTCSLGFVIGVIMILKSHPRFGFGSIVLLLFVLATGISAINSPYHTIVIGHVVLLLGGSILIIGLVYSAPDIKRLEQIERIWFYTIALCVIKDAITSFIFPEPEAGSDILRLGMGITHANIISLLAGLVFLLSFKQTKANKVMWLLRVAMLVVIMGAIGRITILAFTCAGFIYLFLRMDHYYKKLIFVFASLSMIVFLLLAVSLNERVGEPVINYLKRGQSNYELTSFTGRTLIWKQALSQVPEAPFTGHGYGVTQFTLKPITWDYQASHCHNEIIEALFSIGILGTIPLLCMILYNMKWLVFFSRLRRTFSSDIALHGACVFVMLLIAIMFAARISVRLLPEHFLFFFYLLMLDREKLFAFQEKLNFSTTL